MKTGDPGRDGDDLRVPFTGCHTAGSLNGPVKQSTWQFLIPPGRWNPSVIFSYFHIRSQWPSISVSLCLAHLGFLYHSLCLSCSLLSTNLKTLVFLKIASKPQVTACGTSPASLAFLPSPQAVCSQSWMSNLLSLNTRTTVLGSPLYLGVSLPRYPRPSYKRLPGNLLSVTFDFLQMECPISDIL